jgi:hypothetical protein
MTGCSQRRAFILSPFSGYVFCRKRASHAVEKAQLQVTLRKRTLCSIGIPEERGRKDLGPGSSIWMRRHREYTAVKAIQQLTASKQGEYRP